MDNFWGGSKIFDEHKFVDFFCKIQELFLLHDFYDLFFVFKVFEHNFEEKV